MKAARFTVLIGLLALSGCRSSTPEPSASAPNLTGAWTGTLGQPGSGTALRLDWVAVHNGSVAAGPMTIAKPTTSFSVAGTFIGVVAGTQVQVTFSAPRGAVAGFPDCLVLGAGSAAITDRIAGMLTFSWTSCDGVDMPPAATNALVLTRR